MVMLVFIIVAIDMGTFNSGLQPVSKVALASPQAKLPESQIDNEG